MPVAMSSILTSYYLLIERKNLFILKYYLLDLGMQKYPALDHSFHIGLYL